ncbi:MAG: WbqC family protein [Thermoplasmatota archaeon]
MILAATQPTYLPWLGFFELMNRADLFVSYDHVQFSKQSWQQRNRVRDENGARTLTVPVQHSGSRRLCDIRVATGPWKRKHFATLEASYAASIHGRVVLDALEQVYRQPWERLVDLNHAIIQVGRDLLGVRTPMRRSSEMTLATDKNEALVDLCQQLGADEYYSPQGAREYINVERFRDAGIRVTFQEYTPPSYPQRDRTDFISHLCFVDYVANSNTIEVPPW